MSLFEMATNAAGTRTSSQQLQDTNTFASKYPSPPTESDRFIDNQRSRTVKRRRRTPQLICGVCQKSFSRPYNLKSHQLTHTNERPFKCEYPGCGWTFARYHDLKRHDLQHSGIKPHKCSCGKSFSRSDAIKRHQQLTKSCHSIKKGKKRQLGFEK